MNRFSRFLTAVAVLCLSFVSPTCSAADAQPPMRLITEATFPPYEFLRGGEVVGIDVEICRRIATALGRELVVEDTKFDSVIPALISGKADIAAAGITVTEERKAQVDFSIPYVTTGCVFIRKVGTPFEQGEDAKGKRIGVQSGTTSDTYCVETLGQEPERYDSPGSAVQALKTGKIDVVLADIDPAKNCVKGEPGLEISGLVTREDYAVAVQKGNAALLQKANEVIADLRMSELDRIVRSYTEESDALKHVDENETGTEGLVAQFRRCFIENARWRYLTNGLLITLEVALCAVLLGAFLGFLVAVIRSTHDKGSRSPIIGLLNVVCKVYLTVIRGTPMAVQLLIAYFVIFSSCNNKTLVAILAFGCNSGAYVAEIIRAGIMSIDPGQMEAGRALGLSYARTMCRIILPQAVRNVLPALGNEFIVLLKDTSIASFIALQDLSKGGEIIRSQTYNVYMPFLMVAAVYLALVMLFTWCLGKMERHLKNTGASVVKGE